MDPKPKTIKLSGGPHDGMNVSLIAAELCFFFVFDKRTKRFTMYERSEAARDAGENFEVREAPISGAVGCCLVLG